ncbi:MAG TPA: RlmE family RNA methyltransferase [Nitrososphaerales archaeon]|nr:RlmE family RNA methyltransferase [Nitrososphaerales archaeon]
MRLHEARRDLYRRLAREQGYKSRAAFKLIEADERYEFLKPGGKVLDFGSSPGGWLQVASELVGPEGMVVGVDTSPIRVKAKNIVAMKMDIYDPSFQEKALKALGAKADVFLSDLSPTVSGVWELDQGRQVDLTMKVLELATPLLREGGSLFCKLFEGEGSQGVRTELKGRFENVRVIKPAASRNASSELYYFCDDFLP